MARLAVALGLLLLAYSAAAFPVKWINPETATVNCGYHPDVARGPHLAPEPDLDSTFTVIEEGSTTPVPPTTPLCPGTRYTVTVSWPTTLINRALLTTSKGRWENPKVEGCLRSTFLNTTGDSGTPLEPLTAPTTPDPAPGSTFTDILVVTCAATPGTIVLKLTRAQPGQAFLQSQVTYVISPECAALGCAPKPVYPPSYGYGGYGYGGYGYGGAYGAYPPAYPNTYAPPYPPSPPPSPV